MIQKSDTEKKDIVKNSIFAVQSRIDIYISNSTHRNYKGSVYNFTYVSWKRVFTDIDRIYETKSEEEWKWNDQYRDTEFTSVSVYDSWTGKIVKKQLIFVDKNILWYKCVIRCR